MRFHLNLVINNNTTLEYVQAKKLKRTITQKYNVGTANNWNQIFGIRKIFWFLPIQKNDGFEGINYPRRQFEQD